MKEKDANGLGLGLAIKYVDISEGLMFWSLVASTRVLTAATSPEQWNADLLLCAYVIW